MTLFHEYLLFVPSDVNFADELSSFIKYTMSIVAKQSDLMSTATMLGLHSPFWYVYYPYGDK